MNEVKEPWKLEKKIEPISVWGDMTGGQLVIRLGMMMQDNIAGIKEAGLAITPAPSEKTKIKEMLKDPTLRTIERSMLEIYYESLC